MEEYIQQLNIYLKGGQVLFPLISEWKNADKLNTQIDAFFKALGIKTAAVKISCFKVSVLLLCVYLTCRQLDVVSLVRKEKC